MRAREMWSLDLVPVIPSYCANRLIRSCCFATLHKTRKILLWWMVQCVKSHESGKK